MTSPIRKIYFGITDRHQMFRLFGVTTRKCWICPTFENVW
jgi:hypothetical protein